MCFRIFRVVSFLPKTLKIRHLFSIQTLLASSSHERGKNKMSRRKNKHPQRAVNVKTVVVGCREEREEEEEQPPLVLCLKIPDVDVEQNQIRKEETDGFVIRKGAKRKRTHECDVCEKMFDRPSLLAAHMRTHTNEKPYECDVCEKRFRQTGHLKTHMRIHTKEKPYECDVCEKRFSESGTLKRHMRIHTNERPYECDVCEKRFRESGTLKSHMRIHTNEKPYECDVCKKRYRHADSLKYHMRTQH